VERVYAKVVKLQGQLLHVELQEEENGGSSAPTVVGVEGY
jgi:hypothetical protein